MKKTNRVEFSLPCTVPGMVTGRWLAGSAAVMFFLLFLMFYFSGEESDRNAARLMLAFAAVCFYPFLLTIKSSLRITEEGLVLRRSTFGNLFMPSIRVNWDSIEKIDFENMPVETTDGHSNWVVKVPTFKVFYEKGKNYFLIYSFTFREKKSLFIIYSSIRNRAGEKLTEDARKFIDSWLLRFHHK